MVASKPIVVRAGVDVKSDKLEPLAVGAGVHVVESVLQPDGSKRMLVCLEGAPSPYGWVTSLTKDGAVNIAPRGALKGDGGAADASEHAAPVSCFGDGGGGTKAGGGPKAAASPACGTGDARGSSSSSCCCSAAALSTPLKGRGVDGPSGNSNSGSYKSAAVSATGGGHHHSKRQEREQLRGGGEVSPPRKPPIPTNSPPKKLVLPVKERSPPKLSLIHI